jgi:hypothetical protein
LELDEIHFLKSTELSSPITEVALLLVGYDNDQILPLGSAVFIAAGLAMTAKHVIEEFWKQMGSSRPFAGSTPLSGDFNILGVQYPGESDQAALWRVEMGWGSPFTDIIFLSMKPISDLAERNIGHGFVKLDLVPPTINERVVGFGYAASRAQRSTSAEIRLELHPTTTGGIVTAVFPEYRDLSMLRFPCFSMQAHFIGGMSGGPLFNALGHLCGLICASIDGEPISYGACLWPAVMTQITHQGNGMICRGPYPVFELAKVGLTEMMGWDEIQPLIEVVEEPFAPPGVRLRSGW